MRACPFGFRTVVFAKHAQHVVLTHFSIAPFITAVTHSGRLQDIEDRRNDGPEELDRTDPAIGSEVVLKNPESLTRL